MENPIIIAWGESKSAKEWCKDERCRVGIETLTDRVKKLGWDSEKAISQVPQKKTKYPSNYFDEGKVFWYFTSTGKKVKDGHNYCVECICVCGIIKLIPTGALARGGYKSCGCKKAYGTGVGNTIHGGTTKKNKSTLYSIWSNVNDRCYNINSTGYDDYGGRGIINEFNSFIEFRNWAIDSGWRKGLSLERINVNKNYSENNCKWILYGKQQRNKRDTIMITAFGETKSIPDWVEDPRCSLSYRELYWRLVVKKINPEMVIFQQKWQQANHP